MRGHQQLVNDLSACHALTGSDSTCWLHGIGKKTAIKTISKKKLPSFGLIESDVDAIINEATDFIGYCYGVQTGKSMSDKR